MIVYAVTCNVPAPIAEEWLHWMQHEHIPDVVATGYFSQAQVLQLLEPNPEGDAHTYSIQYLCPDLPTLKRYQQEAAPTLQAAHTERYGAQVLAFRTILRKV